MGVSLSDTIHICTYTQTEFIFKIHRISVTDVTPYDSPADCVLFHRKRTEAVFNNNESTGRTALQDSRMYVLTEK